MWIKHIVKMFFSLEPFSGSFIDAYPSYIEERIKNLGTNDYIFLGPDFFNAKIISRNGDIYQVTPGVSILNKYQGLRSVKFLESDYVTVFFNRNNQWSFYSMTPSQTKILKVSDCIRNFGNTLTWQWSSKPSFTQNRENDWVSYNEENANIIESAFTSNEDYANINVGMKEYKIIFIVDDDGNRSVYGKQVCTTTGNRRWVRRCFRDETLFNCPDSETTCALCLEEFENSKHLPWCKTKCGHVFHSACLSRIENTGRCPMCRSNLT